MREEAPTPLTARELLAAAMVYLGLALWWLWPLPAHLGTHAAYTLRGTNLEFAGADWYLIAWALAWGAHALVTQPLRLFDANAFYPAPRSLAFSEHFLGQQPLFAPVYLASGNAVLAVNTVVLGAFVATALGFYALARRFVGAPAALLGGVLFSFAPWRHESLLHLHLLGVQYLPLALLFTERWLERGERRDAWLLAGSLLLQALSSVYLAFALGVLYGPYVALALWRWRRRLDRRRLLGLFVVLASVAAGVALTHVPYVELGRLGLIPSYGRGEYGTAVGVTFSHRMVQHYLTEAGVGRWGYAFAVLALLPPWRGRRWPIVIGLTACAVSLPLALGARALRIGDWSLPAPFPWLVQVLPLLAAIRLPARLVVVTHLGLCLLAALGMQRIAWRLPRVAAWSAAAIVAAGYFFTWSPPPEPELHPVPACADAAELHAWLARYGDGRAVLEWPPPADPFDAAQRMYASTCHWLPEVGGYTAYPMRVAEVVYNAGRALPAEEALQRVVDLIDVGWIVVHESALDAVVGARWDGPLPAGLEPAARFADTRVLRVTRSPIGDRRAHLLDTTESLDGVPLVPVGPRCPGRIDLLGAVPELRLRTSTRLDVAVTNLSERPWPGFGVVPRHLLHVRTCVAPPNVPCTSAPEPLGTDIPAGATRWVRVRVGVPPLVFGPQTLRVELWQLGDGPLEGCGTPPLVVDAQVR